jgi:hypothetical protein
MTSNATAHKLEYGMVRNSSVSIKLSNEEREWLRRKAYWEGTNMAEILRGHLHYLIREEGYLRPPDDEPQDFGYEKEMIEFVNGISGE